MTTTPNNSSFDFDDDDDASPMRDGVDTWAIYTGRKVDLRKRAQVLEDIASELAEAVALFLDEEVRTWGIALTKDEENAMIRDLLSD